MLDEKATMDMTVLSAGNLASRPKGKFGIKSNQYDFCDRLTQMHGTGRALTSLKRSDIEFGLKSQT
jgi:hypothetical protein